MLCEYLKDSHKGRPLGFQIRLGLARARVLLTELGAALLDGLASRYPISSLAGCLPAQTRASTPDSVRTSLRTTPVRTARYVRF